VSNSTEASTQVTSGTSNPGLTISEAACRMLLEIRRQNEIDAAVPLRIFVAGMACSGPQFGLGFDEREREGDMRFDLEGIRLVVDSYAIELLSGASIDYVQVNGKSGFRIHNPTLASGCGATSSGVEGSGAACPGCG
jgi:iron-sulfur cluster assembly accessory protein